MHPPVSRIESAALTGALPNRDQQFQRKLHVEAKTILKNYMGCFESPHAGILKRKCAFFANHFLDRASERRLNRYTLVQDCGIFVLKQGYDCSPRLLAPTQKAINLVLVVKGGVESLTSKVDNPYLRRLRRQGE
jgi:hypothetical protein